MRWRYGLSMLGLLGLMLACSFPVPQIPTPAPLTVIEPVEQQQRIIAEGATQASVRLGLYLGELRLYPGEAVAFFDGRFRYNVAEWEPVIRQEKIGNSLRLTVNQGLGSQLPLTEREKYTNRWEIALGRTIPLDVQADLGTGTAQLDLGGLPLIGLGVTAGAGDVTLTWNTPNPQALGTLRLTAGAGKITASQVGNANFDLLSFVSGTGEADLDLSGTWTRSALVDLKIGAGKVTVRTPAGVGVRLNFSGTPVSELRLVGLTEQRRNVYVNADYGNVPLTLTLNVMQGAGSLTVIAP